MTKTRLRFAKMGKIRWTSHRDVARMWERAFRRVGVPLAYSAGFSPRPKVSFGLALPTGHESQAEYLDIEMLADAPDLDALVPALSEALPTGVEVLAASVIDPRALSLQEAVSVCTWRWAVVAALAPIAGREGSGTDRPPAQPGPGHPPVVIDGAVDAGRLSRSVEELIAAESTVITRVRKGAEVVEDIRPSIGDLRVVPAPDGSEPPPDGASGLWLQADLATQPRSIRPIEVLRALDPALDERSVCRLNQWILRDGARHEPLDLTGPGGERPTSEGSSPPVGAAPVAATDAPHVLGCAS